MYFEVQILKEREILQKEILIQKIYTTFSIRYRQEQLLRNMSGKIIYQRMKTRSERHRKRFRRQIIN